uniref:WAP domain-containing protein n=1 Tax=Junco hyemalis TaxID=40217 RepID=A0A8C5NHX6_JUNHY
TLTGPVTLLVALVRWGMLNRHTPSPRCLLPAEKPGICPLADEAPLAPCGTACTKDGQCPGAQKCCSSSRCGSVCSAPEPVFSHPQTALHSSGSLLLPYPWCPEHTALHTPAPSPTHQQIPHSSVW